MRADRLVVRSIAGVLVSAALVLPGAAPAAVLIPAEPTVQADAPAVLAAPAAPEAVRRATDEVLSRRAYATDEPGWLQRRLADARAWLAARLLTFVQATSRTAVGWAVLAVATLVAAVVTWRLVRGTRWESGRAPVAVDLERCSAAEWDARSREAERRGDLREAVRTAYRAVLSGLAEAGLVEEVEGRTVGEYRAQVAVADPARAERFARASDVVEAVLYADRPATGDDLDVVRQSDRRPVGASA